jgi:BirA family transcriptional regulator, biotin operon repressor / biotin---[acetyl-CoA-carboxylase] ligase
VASNDYPLSPSLVGTIIREEELPLRCRTVDSETAAAVCRYGAPVGGVIECHSRLGRGMEYARRLIGETEAQGRSFATGTVIVAGELTGGKGRFQRAWHAPPGGLWLTLILVNTLLPAFTRLYPLAAGLACCEAVRGYGIDARLKWVNDVHVGGRKLVGVLAETMIGPRFGEEYILIGVGVNINNTEFPPELASLAVSMRSLLGREIGIDRFAARLLAKLAWNIGLLHHEEQERLAAGDPESDDSPLLAAWRAHSDTIGRRVRFGYDVQQHPQYEARAVELAADGALVLRLLPDGPLVTEHAGEILYLD